MPGLRIYRSMGLMLLLLPGAAAAQQQTAWQTVGQIGGPTQAVAVQGSYAYVGVGSRMVVLDVSVAGELREVGVTPPFPHLVADIAVSGTLAYVAAGGAGLRVVDVTDPGRPVEVGAWESRGYAEGVAVAGTIAYLADGPYGLRVIDVSKPSQPVEVGSAFTLNYAFKVVASGSYVYIAAAGAGLLIADTSDPARPVELSRTALPGFAYGLAVSESMVYLAGGWVGLEIVRVADPSQPVLVGWYKTPGWALGVAVAGRFAYVGDSSQGLRVLDVSDPAGPVELASDGFSGGHIAAVALVGGTAYLAAPNWGLRVVDVATPSQPVEVGSYSPMGFADAVAVTGNYAYVAAGAFGLRVVDISDPSRPLEVGAYDTESHATGVAVAGNYAYVCGSNPPSVADGLHVVDISDPRRLVRTGYLNENQNGNQRGPCRDMVLDGGIVYEATEWGLRVIDVSRPAEPTEIAFFQVWGMPGAETMSQAIGVAVSGNIAYVALGSAGLKILDVSRPANPVELAQVRWPNAFAQGVVVADGRAYVADTGRLTVIDVSDPLQPAWIGSLATDGFQESVTVDGHTAYVADGGAGLTVLDVSGASPVRAEGYNTPGYAQQVAVRGQHVFVADMDGGLLILRKTPAGSAPAAGLRPESRMARRAAQRVRPVPSTYLAGRKGILPPSGVKSKILRPTPPAAVPCLVSSASDSGPGTLRACMETAVPGTTISFDATVFPATQPVTISPLATLPWLTQGEVTIDASDAGVILSGRQARPGNAALTIRSSWNRIMGLQIMGFPNDGISVQEPATGNRIGGDRRQGAGPVGQGNRISGNAKFGIQIYGRDATDSVITGNLIGTDITGTVADGNGDSGIFLVAAMGTRIGGSTPGERNIVSGNKGAGIDVGATRTLVIGNYVGTDETGTIALANGGGIRVTGPENQIGGSSPQDRNVLSGNWQHGIGFISAYAFGNIVEGNYIGVDASGSRLLTNQDHGVAIEMGANHNLIRNNVIVTYGQERGNDE